MITALLWLFGAVPHPDGQAAGLQAVALGEALPDAMPARQARRLAPRPESVLESALAEKLLQGWMQNRLQTRYPLTLNLAGMKQDEAALLLEAVGYALRATDPGEAGVAAALIWVGSIGGAAPAIGRGDGDASLVRRLHAARLTPHAYAICAGALRRRTLAARRFLEFFAARLDVPDEVARSLNRRFAS